MRSAPKPLVRFPLTMALRYQITSEQATVSGVSATKWIGSRQIAFAACEDIEEKSKIHIAIAWPILLEDRVPLQLTIKAIVTKVANGIAEAAILQYDFRTRKDQEPATAANPTASPGNPIPPSPHVLAMRGMAHL
jgi:hypothetical protein